MKKNILQLFILLFISLFLKAQPSIQWQQSFGGTGIEYAYSVQQMADTGYLVAGYSTSHNGNVTLSHGSADSWIVKLNSAGVIEWQKSLGGTSSDEAISIQKTLDSGYIFAGQSYSNNFDVSGNHGGSDYWVVKLNNAGTIQWQKSLGGSGDDEAFSVQQTSDTGYIVAGYSNSINGDVTGNLGVYDYWIVKLDSGGALEWEKSIGGTAGDYANSIEQTFDGGYIVSGYSYSNDFDVSGNHGSTDCWIVKLDRTGNIEWQKALGGTVDDEATIARQTSDSGYIVSGYSLSNDGDVSGNHGGVDFWIVKLSPTGSIVWQKSLGGTGTDVANDIHQTSDGNYIVAGHSRSNDGDVSSNHGNQDYWIVKLDTGGAILWQKSFGGTNSDVPNSIVQTFDGDYLIAGKSNSNDGDVSGNHGSDDFWIVKLSSTVMVDEIQNASMDFKISPNPFSDRTSLDFNHPFPEHAIIEIHDLQGRLIKNLIPSSNGLIWDATNNSGNPVNAGVYLISIRSDVVLETQKIVVLKN